MYRQRLSVFLAAAALLLLCALCVDAKRFMTPTMGRRKLAQASAPATSLQPGACRQQAYLTTEPTPDAIFDQLTPEEYISVAQFLVRVDTETARSKP